ncbi:MAG: peptide chain release factor 2 [Actinobacteria bacterium]|nr:peptide chain release factor 2 [Actinomycetota bacterium]MCI0677438.1 peptide chain release factor 2 [Actinomycetota bacterium]
MTEPTDPYSLTAELRKRLDEARVFLDLEGKATELDALREKVASPDLWEDPDEARSVSRRLARYQALFEKVNGLESRIDDAEVLLELADEAGDEASRREAIESLTAVDAILDELELESLFFDEYDDSDAILSVHAGAGGVDAQDWAEMLARMYQRYLADHGFTTIVEEVTEGEEAGIKSATFTVRGDRAYGNLESERGVHRLVRISPFDSNSRRHTSFAGVDVVPDLGEAVDVEIDEEELRVDTYRSQGAGGQHVNTSDTAVRITHLPSGIVVQCQNERSQLQNKNRAMAMLKAKLAERARLERIAHISEIRGEQGEAAWGRQVRSYVLQPYQLAKDLRTDHEVGNVQGVLDGDLQGFIEAYLRWRRARHETRGASD